MLVPLFFDKIMKFQVTDYIVVGQVLKTLHTDGRLKVAFNEGFLNIDQIEDYLFVMINKKPVPFSIENIEIVSDSEAVVKFEDINSKESAKAYLNKDIAVHKNVLSSDQQQLDFDDFIGFSIFNIDGQLIGIIDDIFYSPGQYLIQCKSETSQYLIPLHEDLIIESDVPNKKLVLIIPEGLLDL